MADHVDVIKNEWLAGFQHVVARVYMGERGLSVDTDAPNIWEPIIKRSFIEAESGREISFDDDPAEFFWHLQEHVRSDYLFATEPHDEAHCPWHNVVVPIGRPAGAEAAAGVR